MRNRFPYLQASRGSAALILFGIMVIGGSLFTPTGHSQAPATTTSNAALNVLLVKLKTQQDTMVANQAKIEAQTATLKENLRQAKIYAGRSGAGRR